VDSRLPTVVDADADLWSRSMDLHRLKFQDMHITDGDVHV